MKTTTIIQSHYRWRCCVCGAESAPGTAVAWDGKRGFAHTDCAEPATDRNVPIIDLDAELGSN